VRDIALAVDADGVHLGQQDLPLAAARGLLGANKIIGISTHNEEQARAASEGGADYIGLGPIFPTATKDAGPMVGVEGLRHISSAMSVPVIAIGGIGEEQARTVRAAGATGIAVISAVLGASDMENAIRSLQSQFGG
jgi:thiamine-phosphate pyrophosphorylase